MQVNNISRNNTNFTSLLTNKTALKALEKISEHGTSFSAATALTMSLTVRPLAILSTPDVEKENKQYACANSIGSGLIKFGIVETVALPIEYAVKKIDANPQKYLKKDTIKSFTPSAAVITDSKSYRLAAQTIKLGAGLLSAIPKSVFTIAFIPVIMDKLFNLKILPTPKIPSKSLSEEKNQTGKIPFTGRLAESIPKGIGKILDWDLFKNFAIRNENNDKNIAKHMSAATDILLTSSFALQTNKSRKIKEERKKALIYNNVISTAITLSCGYFIDSLIKNRTQKFIDKFSKLHKNDPKLPKYIEGLNIVRPAIIFAAIYYGILPVISTYTAEKIDKKLSKNVAGCNKV